MRPMLRVLPAALLAVAPVAGAEEPTAPATPNGAGVAAETPTASRRTDASAAPFVGSGASGIGVGGEAARLVTDDEGPAEIDTEEAFPQLDDSIPDAAGVDGKRVGLGLTGLGGAGLSAEDSRGPDRD